MQRATELQSAAPFEPGAEGTGLDRGRGIGAVIGAVAAAGASLSPGDNFFVGKEKGLTLR